jgi:hypothetical protein
MPLGIVITNNVKINNIIGGVNPITTSSEVTNYKEIS